MSFVSERIFAERRLEATVQRAELALAKATPTFARPAVPAVPTVPTVPVTAEPVVPGSPAPSRRTEQLEGAMRNVPSGKARDRDLVFPKLDWPPRQVKRIPTQTLWSKVPKLPNGPQGSGSPEFEQRVDALRWRLTQTLLPPMPTRETTHGASDLSPVETWPTADDGDEREDERLQEIQRLTQAQAHAEEAVARMHVELSEFTEARARTEEGVAKIRSEYSELTEEQAQTDGDVTEMNCEISQLSQARVQAEERVAKIHLEYIELTKACARSEEDAAEMRLEHSEELQTLESTLQACKDFSEDVASQKEELKERLRLTEIMTQEAIEAQVEAFREMDFDLAGMELKLQNEQNELEVVAREGVLLEEHWSTKAEELRHELSEELKLAELLPSIELQSAESQAKAELCAGRLAEQRAELCADHERDRDQRDQLDQLQLQLREECAVAGRREEQNRYLHEICQQLTEMEEQAHEEASIQQMEEAKIQRLQGEFAALEVQLKELREELCGEQQTNHQMTFCEAKLAEKLQGECAAMDMQLKELRRELRGEQQTYHQMTFSEAKLAEKFPALELDLANLRAKQEVSERRLAKLSAKEIAEAQRFASQEESAQQLRGKLNRQLHLARQETDMAHRAESLVCEEASIQQKQKVRVQRLQGEFASSEAQLKELRVELQKEQQRYEQVVFNERQLKQQLELQEDSARRRELLLGEESRRRTEQAQAEAQGLIARVQELQDLERERYTAEVQAKKKELQRLATLQIEKEDFLQQIGDLQARLAQEQQAGKFLASQRMAAAKVQASVTEEMREILAERETDDAHQEARQRACAEELMDLRLDLELKTAAVAMSKERKPFVWRESPKPARSVGSSRARAARAESPRVVTQEAENKQTAAVPTVADELVALDEALKSFQAATEQGIKKAQQDSKTTELLLRGRLARAEAVSMRLQRELQVSEAQRNLGGTFQVLVMEAEEAQKAEAIGAEASGAEIEEPSSEDEEDEEDDDQTNKEMDEDDTQNSDDGHAEPPVSHSPIKAGAMGAGAQLGWRKSWAPQQFAKQLGEAVPPRGGLQKSQTTPVEWLDDDVEFHENDATRAVEDRAGRARSWRKSWAPESEHPLEIVDVRD